MPEHSHAANVIHRDFSKGRNVPRAEAVTPEDLRAKLDKFLQGDLKDILPSFYSALTDRGSRYTFAALLMEVGTPPAPGEMENALSCWDDRVQSLQQKEKALFIYKVALFVLGRNRTGFEEHDPDRTLGQLVRDREASLEKYYGNFSLSDDVSLLPRSKEGMLAVIDASAKAFVIEHFPQYKQQFKSSDVTRI